MPVSTPSFECPGAALRRRVVTAWFGCVMLTACAQPATVADTSSAPQSFKPAPMTVPEPTPASVQAISAITLERDCMGCPTGMRLELRRDGQAVATATGKARLRTSDSVSRAALPAAEFDALARQLLAAGFFDLAEVYEEAGVADGSWATLTAVRGGVARQVFRREDAGPPALKSLEAAMIALQARLVFVADAR